MARTPDYQRIANEYRDRIKSGELKAGDRLPSISQLQKQYGVSAQPVKSALLVLQTEGLVEGHQGRAGIRLPEGAGMQHAGRQHIVQVGGRTGHLRRSCWIFLATRTRRPRILPRRNWPTKKLPTSILRS